MNSAANPATAVDPDEVLRGHTRELSAAYRAELAEAYQDPRDTARRFYEEASRVGPADAAIRMREAPERFGSLVDGGEAAARRAAVLGAKAYHSRVAEGEPRVGAAVLDQAITDRLQAVRGIDREQVRSTWDALARAYGPDRAAEVFTRRHRDVLGDSMIPAEAAQLARFAAARDHLRARAGLLQAPAHERSAPLPRSLEEAGETGLPRGLQERLLAASDGLRKRLRGAYEFPLAAEARLHRMVDEQGIDAIVAVHRDPTVLGPLRGDLPGGTDRARGLAASAMDHAETAYGYHRARGPGDAERLLARDAFDDARRGARDAERAMEGIQEAVQLHGPELRAHLDRQRERTIEPGDPAPRGPAREGPGPDGGPGALPAGGPDPNASPGASRTGDPAVDAAVRAHMELREAREIEKRLPALRAERRKAEEKLAELGEQDAALTRARRDLRAVAAEVYRKPDAAIGKWQELVAADGLERARERLREDASILGELRNGREPGRVRRAAEAAIRAWRGSPVGEEQGGTDPRSRLAGRAEAFAKADAATRQPVGWTTPDGEKVAGREKVREAAQRIADGRQREIDAGEKRLKKLGGVEGAEKTAARTLDVLSPGQREAATRQISRLTGASVLDVATGMARKTVEAARVARTLGEGPAGL